MLELENITKKYKNNILFDQLNLKLNNPGFYLITGKSGQGKTTLLNILAGFISFEKGERKENDCNIAYIFQEYELINELTVIENLRLNSRVFNSNFETEFISKLGLDDLLHHYPSELSGGQKQRVGIARALMQEPNFILCDEPTESLDIDNANIVIDLLKELSSEVVVVVVSHQKEILEKYCDAHLEVKDGKLITLKNDIYPKNIKTSNKAKTTNNGELNKIIIDIFRKSRQLLFGLFMLFVIIGQLLFTIESKIFEKSDSMDALNANIVYVKVYDQLSLPKTFNTYAFKPIVNFNNTKIKGNEHSINVYPIKDNRVVDNRVIVNQNILKLFNPEKETDILNKEIELSFYCQHVEWKIPFIITDIVFEKDVNEPQIYYSNEYLYHFFGQEFMDDYLENSSDLQLICDDVRNSYSVLKEYSGMRVYHSILTNRFLNEKTMNLYHFIYITIEIIFVLLVMISTIHMTKKVFQKDQRSLSVLCSLGVPINAIKRCYLGKNMNYLLIYACVMMFLITVSDFLIIGKIQLLSFVGITIQLLISIFTIVFGLKNWNREKTFDSIRINID